MNRNDVFNVILRSSAIGGIIFALNEFFLRHYLGGYDLLIYSFPLGFLFISLTVLYTKSPVVQTLALPQVQSAALPQPQTIIQIDPAVLSRLEKVETILKDNGIVERKPEPLEDVLMGDEQGFRELEKAIEN